MRAREFITESTTSVDIPSTGINVRSDIKAGRNYADLIVDGKKYYETRNNDKLRSYVGKRVSIVRTGNGLAKAIGAVTVGEPIKVDEKQFRKLESKHLVPQGSDFDIKSGTVKYLFPMIDPVRYNKEYDVSRYGIIARKVNIAESVESPEFKRWFAGSQVVDAKGNPLVVYHGTNVLGGFKSFKTDPSNQLGAHFAVDPRISNQFTGNEGGHVYPVYLSIKNPLNIVSDLGDWSDMDSLKEYLGPANYEVFTDEELDRMHTPKDIVRGLRSKGYDGMAYENYHEGERYDIDNPTSYIAFSPTQIKSAVGNTGKWSRRKHGMIDELKNVK